MNRTLIALGVLLFAATTYANDLSSTSDETNARFFFDNDTTLNIGTNTLLAGVFGLLVLGLLAALLTFFLFGSGEETTGYADTSYSSYGSGRAAYVYNTTLTTWHAGDGYINKWVYEQVRRWWDLHGHQHRHIDNATQTCAKLNMPSAASAALGATYTLSSIRPTTPTGPSSSALSSHGICARLALYG